MKVLWFSVTPSLYESRLYGHNGGGWISSLEKIVRDNSEIELSIAFEHPDKMFKVKQNGVTYYPINLAQKMTYKVKRRFSYEVEENTLIPYCLKVIEDCKPDIIQVFGSEWCFGLIAEYIQIPIIIHLQGSIPPYLNALYPPGYSKLGLYSKLLLRPLDIYRYWREERNFVSRAKREERILRQCNYFMGRTCWDRQIIELYNSTAKYFYCSEMLRDDFVKKQGLWSLPERKTFVFVSTISCPLYKGLDLILKTAKLIKENSKIEFEWKVYGIDNGFLHEKILGIKADEVNVRFEGVVSSETLVNNLLEANLYIHPSYIDNSPNSLCEAQLLGLPILSTNVGGISSLVEHNVTGILFPANDPYSCACNVIRLCEDNSHASMLGKHAFEVASKRHEADRISRRLYEIYSCITNKLN